MAWSDAARAAALETRRAHAGERKLVAKDIRFYRKTGRAAQAVGVRYGGMVSGAKYLNQYVRQRVAVSAQFRKMK